VEVPCLVDHNGVQPTAVGPLPLQLASLNRTNIGVQTLAVQAASNGDRENVYHAVALDPLTAALCTLEQARAMTDELLEAHRDLLPAELVR
jgi:alpha-galactosidase